MEQFSFDNILVRHWIKFDCHIENFYAKETIHYLYTVQNSIHYRSLILEDYSEYEKLILSTDQFEHSLDKFLELKNNFDIDRLETNKIVLEWSSLYNKYIVVDGVHRLSILLYKNICNLNSNWFFLIK